MTVETHDATFHGTSDQELQADSGLLMNLFGNLFRNAVEHGGTDVTVTVGPLADGFYVEDTGPGIPSERHEEIFEIGATTNAHGTGFGLGIVQQIVDKHGWEIAVETSRTGGARFEVYTRPVFPETK